MEKAWIETFLVRKYKLQTSEIIRQKQKTTLLCFRKLDGNSCKFI